MLHINVPQDRAPSQSHLPLHAPTPTTHPQGVDTKWERITPERARHVLAHQNKNNRNLNSGLVRTLVETIQAGGWVPTHQGIAFCVDGTLADGQHRLAAIAEAGIEVTVAVTYNLPFDARKVIDTGKNRTVLDNLKIVGSPDIAGVNGRLMTDTASMVYMLKNRTSAHRDSVTKFEATMASSVGPGIRWAASLPSIRHYMTASTRGALAYAHAENPQKVEAFAQRYVDNLPTGKSDPVWILRKHIEVNPPRTSGSERTALAHRVARAVFSDLYEHGTLTKLFDTTAATSYFGESKHGVAVPEEEKNAVRALVARSSLRNYTL